MSPSDYILIITHSDKPRHPTKQKNELLAYRSDDNRTQKVSQEIVFPSSVSKAPSLVTLKVDLFTPHIKILPKKKKLKTLKSNLSIYPKQGKSVKLSNTEHNK